MEFLKILMSNSKACCVTCNKGIGQFKCEGCLQTFCMKHVTEHRQRLSQQLDEVIVEHDLFQQTIIDDQNRKHRLLVYIDQWEEKSIEKIRQTAQDIREQIDQLENIHKGERFFDSHTRMYRLLSNRYDHARIESIERTYKTST